MVIELARNWWALALRGLAAIIFGVVAWIWPDLTVTALVILFGAYALVDGAFAIVTAVTRRARDDRLILVLQGIAGIALGIMTLVWPDITALTLLYFIAAWAILTGIFEVVAAIRLRRVITGEFLLALSGVASIIFGLAIAIFPGSGAVALVWLIGAYAVVIGILLIMLAFRLRNWQDNTRRPAMRASA
ncbi:MAG: hypothetical protein QOJ59_1364 [Thermomicrobiales bacterium]|jgi:uncharacterized membrane protein HdeD (DUF308 family)|nr:hypothetical protein [Thermomicrobiales bacterium]